jgi:hypothetical protein
MMKNNKPIVKAEDSATTHPVWLLVRKALISHAEGM